jgi:hypothetical protein
MIKPAFINLLSVKFEVVFNSLHYKTNSLIIYRERQVIYFVSVVKHINALYKRTQYLVTTKHMLPLNSAVNVNKIIAVF